MIITQMKIRTEIAEPRPRFSRLISSWYPSSDTDAVLLAPLVTM